MKTASEITDIADNEALHEDSTGDISDEDFSRKRLWISAFKLGYEMGQWGVKKYKEIDNLRQPAV